MPKFGSISIAERLVKPFTSVGTLLNFWLNASGREKTQIPRWSRSDPISFHEAQIQGSIAFGPFDSDSVRLHESLHIDQQVLHRVSLRNNPSHSNSGAIPPFRM